MVTLDDLRGVTKPLVVRALDYFLEHLPAQMNTAMTTCYDLPLALARGRARRRLAMMADFTEACSATEETLTYPILPHPVPVDAEVALMLPV